MITFHASSYLPCSRVPGSRRVGLDSGDDLFALSSRMRYDGSVWAPTGGDGKASPGAVRSDCCVTPTAR